MRPALHWPLCACARSPRSRSCVQFDIGLTPTVWMSRLTCSVPSALGDCSKTAHQTVHFAKITQSGGKPAPVAGFPENGNSLFQFAGSV
jgi:hypothetical protein